MQVKGAILKKGADISVDTSHLSVNRYIVSNLKVVKY